MSAHDIVTILALGAAAGVLSGMLGIGGGVVMVPGLVLLLGDSQHVAEGTSLLVIIPTAATGVLTHWRRGLVLPWLALLIGVTGAAGALLGSHLALGAGATTLRRIFVVFLVVVGLRMLVPVRRPRPRREVASRPGDASQRRT